MSGDEVARELVEAARETADLCMADADAAWRALGKAQRRAERAEAARNLALAEWHRLWAALRALESETSE
jgi:hypothetical protein